MNSEQSKNPLFIIGSPRSGTSLLRLIMTTHSEVVVPPECGLIIWLHSKYVDWSAEDNRNAKRLKEFISDVLECKKMDTWQLTCADLENHIRSQQPKNYAELCSAVYSTYARKIGRKFRIWGDKNNFYIHHLEELRSIYGHARFLHLVRDGRDVACSYREVMSSNTDSPYAPTLRTDIDAISSEWMNNVLKADAFMESLPIKDRMTVKYEQLVSDPTKNISDICRWLELRFEMKMMDFHRENRKKSLEPKLTLDWKKRTLQPISGETVGRYKEQLNGEETRRFDRSALAALQRFGYS